MCCQMGGIGNVILQVAQKAIVRIQFLSYSPHQVDKKNVVKSSKHFFGYFNTLETHSAFPSSGFWRGYNFDNQWAHDMFMNAESTIFITIFKIVFQMPAHWYFFKLAITLAFFSILISIKKFNLVEMKKKNMWKKNRLIRK